MLHHHRTKLIGRQLIQVLPVILLATFVVFGLMQLVPGDPAVSLAGEYATPERVEEIRRLYGFDQPFLVQYWHWLSGVVRGDLSMSMQANTPVLDLILQRLPYTLLVVVMALAISMTVGTLLGTFAATRPGGVLDTAALAFSSLGVALPSFWLAMILLSIFSLTFQWFPASGVVEFSRDPWEAIRHATLPAIALSAGGIAEIARQLRASLLEILSAQFVRTLRAKGMTPALVLWKHGLKNVSINLLTVFGLQVNRLLGATVVIEAVFAIPGVGSLIVASAIAKDFPVVQGVVLFMVIIVVFVNLSIEVLYTLLDPRVA